ncbi:MAG: RNA 2',3'-cyclic phosphodiesterase [Desulfobacteraceae bacterium]|nr:RNA 2',3'-cyclic phosphodiesterase [Desulfobacteraceae bacterium]
MNDTVNKKSIRAFIAINCPAKVIAHLENLQAQLKKHKIKASWPKPSNMHLTLKFLGDVPYSKIQDIQNSITATVFDFKKENSSLSLSTKSIGVFPSVKKPRVVWSGIKSDIKGQTNPLETIHSLLESHLTKQGFKKEKNQYFPHITLCRIKQRISEKHISQVLEKYSDIESDTFLVKQITLFKSKLTSSGAVHTKLFSQKT